MFTENTVNFFSNFMPHGHCYNYLPSLLWTNALSDALIAASYFSVPIALFLYIRKKPDFRFIKIGLLFVAFIFLCGVTHVFGVYTIWYGQYGLHAIAKLLTGIVSFATAVIVFRALPLALQIPTLEEHKRAVINADEERIKRIQAETAAQEQAKVQRKLNHFQRVLHAVNDGIWEWDIGTDNIWFSEKACDLLGVPYAKEHKFSRWRDHIHPDDLKNVEEAIKAHIENGAPYDVFYRGRSTSGEYEWMHTRGSLQPEQDGPPIYMSGILTNVNDVRHTALQLQQKDEELTRIARAHKQIFEQVAVGIAKVRLDDTIEDTNAQMAYMLETTATELKGQSFTSTFHESDRATDAELKQRLIERQIDHFSVEKRLVQRSGGVIWTQLTYAINVDELNQPEAYLVVAQDITYLKKAQTDLAESNSALERFAYAASHDLQEPLRKICSFSQRLEARLSAQDLDAAGQFELERITNAAARMSAMITSLLALSRISNTHLALDWVSLQTIVTTTKDTLALLIEDHHARIELINNCECLVDRQSFLQMFQNLISNAIHYAREGVPAVITINCQDDRKCISIRDNGIGIDSQHAEAVFSPFKRLNQSDGRGQGMGLAICRQIAKAHQGTLTINTEVVGYGTEFILRLPAKNMRCQTQAASLPKNSTEMSSAISSEIPSDF